MADWVLEMDEMDEMVEFEAAYARKKQVVGGRTHYLICWAHTWLPEDGDDLQMWKSSVRDILDLRIRDGKRFLLVEWYDSWVDEDDVGEDIKSGFAMQEQKLLEEALAASMEHDLHVATPW